MISSHILTLQCHLTTIAYLEPQEEYLTTVITLTTVVRHLILLFDESELL